jgi:hypothetical protein
MTDPRKDGIVPDPSQLAEMQVTDARLDRIGRRAPEPEDLADPVFAALAGLAEEVDHVDPATQDDTVSRLLEVLEGRPLWVLDGEELSDLDAAARNMIMLDDPAWAERRRHVIDLRRPEADGDAADDAGTAGTGGRVTGSGDAGEAAEAPAAAVAAATTGIGAGPGSVRTGDDAPPADDAPETTELPAAARTATTEAPATTPAGSPVVPLRKPRPRVPGRPAPAGEEPWVRAMRRVSLPAAAAITLFTLGGGVTAALTGDPMAPLTGVSRVVDSIAGSGSGPTYSSLQENLDRARSALASGDVDEARSLIESARSGLDHVPAAQATLLQQQIEDVQKQIAEEEAPAAPVPAPSASATAPPVVTNPTPTAPPPSATHEPSPTQSDPTPTSEPSETPQETPSPSQSSPAAEPSEQSEQSTISSGAGSTGSDGT